jgi:hypothetical protein
VQAGVVAREIEAVRIVEDGGIPIRARERDDDDSSTAAPTRAASRSIEARGSGCESTCGTAFAIIPSVASIP